MELTQYSAISFYIKNQEWGEKNDTKSSQQSTFTSWALQYWWCEYLWSYRHTPNFVNICGPADTHQTLWISVVLQTHTKLCEYLWSCRHTPNFVNICGPADPHQTLWISVVLQTHTKLCEYLWSYRHTPNFVHTHNFKHPPNHSAHQYCSNIGFPHSGR